MVDPPNPDPSDSQSSSSNRIRRILFEIELNYHSFIKIALKFSAGGPVIKI
jgi:hypothetical protein